MKQILAVGTVFALVLAPCFADAQQFERHGNGGTFYDITDQNRQTAISEANAYCKGLGMTAQIHFVMAPVGGGVSETALVFVCK
jgi:5-formyltetrahydrofolate cyclo-ligase